MLLHKGQGVLRCELTQVLVPYFCSCNCAARLQALANCAMFSKGPASMLLHDCSALPTLSAYLCCRVAAMTLLRAAVPILPGLLCLPLPHSKEFAKSTVYCSACVYPCLLCCAKARHSVHVFWCATCLGSRAFELECSTLCLPNRSMLSGASYGKLRHPQHRAFRAVRSQLGQNNRAPSASIVFAEGE